ncbi:MAG TPA: ABC transporter ATP-binding protein [Nitrososphaerales archaeon]|nr:ABC transporter ATP-binding protein [Nitrososphaerales archaeon]
MSDLKEEYSPLQPRVAFDQVVLRTENLSKSYSLKKRRISALKDVLLEIKRGEFVAIMGHSGSGKTTLLSMLGCLDKPTTGAVFVDNVDVSKMRDSHLFRIRRDKIGFVFQSFNLLPYLNARENVELAMESTKKSKSERSSRAKELLAMVGLEGREDHRPQQLSGGEQQRVAIARALANDPAVILADELTGNLDNKTRNEIMKLLINLNLKQGTTIVIVTHDKDIAWQTERILRLKNGRIDKEYKGVLSRRKEQEQRRTNSISKSEAEKIDLKKDNSRGEVEESAEVLEEDDGEEDDEEKRQVANKS